jgi:hypothetical protein
VKRGIYALGRISKINLEMEIENVQARLIDFSADDQEPLISYDENKDLFNSLFCLRRRGAEIFIPRDFEGQIFELIKSNHRTIARCDQLSLILPGSPNFPKYVLTQVPLIDLDSEVSDKIKHRDVVCGYFIRPRQASWIRDAPDELLYITDAFSGFKKGDMSNILYFADALATQIEKYWHKNKSRYPLITSVPLCQQKLRHGEVDRVAELAKAIADRIGTSYESLFILKGRVSRRLYKVIGYGTDKFVADYKQNLTIIKRSMIRDLALSDKELLLVDDVYTDGITTSTIIDSCRSMPGCEHLNIRVATLGLMLKKGNISNIRLRRLFHDN